MDETVLREFMYILTGFEGSMPGNLWRLARSAVMPNLDLLLLFYVLLQWFEGGMMTEKKRAEGRCPDKPFKPFTALKNGSN